ncbi:MAG: hypothetical protein CFE44_05010, partial [Burkholderiales bacterium PBB4]
VSIAPAITLAPQVVAVVVTYQPHQETLLALLRALAPQVARVVVVDNAAVGSEVFGWKLAERFHHLELLQLGSNQGIAAAQNRGMARAIEWGASHVLLSDQDSVAEPTLVAQLLHGLAVCAQAPGAATVAAIGPATVDVRTGRVSSFIPAGRTRSSSRIEGHNTSTLPLMEVGFLIASGTLIPVEVIAKMGGVRSEYFIDHVDTEWCFRVRAAGYRLMGVTLPLLHHRLGDHVQKVWLLRERHVARHAPLRDYYMARNTLALLKTTSLSLGWRAHFVWRVLQYVGFYILLSGDKLAHLKMLALGLSHGLHGTHGKLNPQTLETEAVPRSALDPQP